MTIPIGTEIVNPAMVHATFPPWLIWCPAAENLAECAVRGRDAP